MADCVEPLRGTVSKCERTEQTTQRHQTQAAATRHTSEACAREGAPATHEITPRAKL